MAGYSGTPLPQKLGINVNTAGAKAGRAPELGLTRRREKREGQHEAFVLQNPAPAIQKRLGVLGFAQFASATGLKNTKQTSRPTTDLRPVEAMASSA